MKPVVKGINIQRPPADADNIRVLGLGFQHFNIRVHGRHVLVMHGGRLRQRPFVLLAVLQQIARVFLQQLIIQPALFRGRNIVFAQALKDRVDLIHIDGHAVDTFPVIRAAVRYNAGAQRRINLIQQDPQAGNQRLQRILRIDALILIPQGIQELLVRHRLSLVQNQILNQGRPFLGLGRQVIRLFLVNKNQEMIHHLDSDRIRHGIHPPSERSRSCV